MIRVDIRPSIVAEVIQRLRFIGFVDGNQIAVRPDFNADQRYVDALWMVKLQQYTRQSKARFPLPELTARVNGPS